MNKPTMAVLLGCATAIVVLSVAQPVRAQDSAAAKPTQEQPAPPITVADPNYLVQEEDVVRLDVWGEPDISGIQMQVTPGLPHGKINVPYIGDIEAEGRTQAEIAKAIADEFQKAEILYKPRVVITLITMHHPTVRVVGAVQRVGEFQFKDGDRVLDAVAQAGYAENAWLDHATVTHRGSNQKPIPVNLKDMLSKGDYSQNYLLEKGDVINIPLEDYENKFYVMGEVNRPMMYDLKDNTTVLAAINLAGGQTQRAALRSTMIIRKNKDGKPDKVPCDLGALFAKGDLTKNITLEPGDVVYVPETKKPNWNNISQILSTITSLTYIRRYGLF